MEKMTEAELEVMKCAWELDRPFTPSEVLVLLNGRFERGWNLQSICTYLLRMAGKGFLKYDKHNRKTIYSIIVTEEAYFSKAAIDFADFWGQGTLKRMAVALNKGNRLTADEIQELRDYWNAIEK